MNADRIGQIVHRTSGGATLASFSYTYDQVGNRLSMFDNLGRRTSWTYDRLSQLTREETPSLSFDVSHQYDGVGNRLVRIQGSRRTTYTYDAAKQLATGDGKGDGDGKGTEKETRSELKLSLVPVFRSWPRSPGKMQHL